MSLKGIKTKKYGATILNFFSVLVFVFSTSSVFAGVNTNLSGDDNAAGPFPIGFSFRLYDKTFTEFYTSTNGLISFNGPNNSYSNACLPASADTLYVFWDDLRTDSPEQVNGKIEYQTVGQAPNRKLIVQWTNQYFYGSNLPMGTFQAVLSEGSNEIKYQYRYLTDERAKGDSATIGIQGTSSLQQKSSGCNTPLILQSEKALSYTPDIFGIDYILDTNAPYEFLDISGLTPSPPSTAGTFANESIAWSWDKIPTLNNYQIDIYKSDGTPIKTAVIGDVGTFVFTEAINGNSYIARVRGSINSGSTWELWSGYSLPVTFDTILPSVSLNNFKQIDRDKFQLSFLVTDDLSGVATQTLQISNEQTFGQIVFEQNIAVGVTSYEYSGAQSGDHLYARIEGKDNAGNMKRSNILDLVVVPPPTADFELNVIGGEAPLDVNIINKSTGAIFTYTWTFGNGKSSAEIGPITRYITPGSYEIKLQVSGIAGSNEKSKTITVTPDVTGPTLTQSLFGSVALDNSPTLSASGTISIKASDKSSISRVMFSLDGEVLANVLITNSAGAYELPLNLSTLTDGNHNLTINIYDALDNVTHKSYSFTVDLAAPSAPVINIPASNLTTNQKTASVSGTSTVGTKVTISNNGSALPAVPVDSNGKFSAVVDLQEGTNRVIARAQYIDRSKLSAESVSRTVTVNTQIPNAPTGVTSTVGKQGQIFVAWNTVLNSGVNNQVKGYNVYRSNNLFTLAGEAGVSRVNTQLITVNSFTDVVAADGKYFYAVSAVNQDGNESSLSSVISAIADSQGPKIVQLKYISDGNVDAASGRFGVGNLQITATFNEPLRNAPYFAIVPDKGVPITVELTKNYGDEKQYSGQFQIVPSTPAGMAYAVMSAYDNAGNRGTDIDQGATLKIDTHGPDLAELLLSPSAPLKVDPVNGLIINVNAKLNDETKQSQAPKLIPLLDNIVVAGYAQGIPLVLGGSSAVGSPEWNGTFSLPNTAGKNAMVNLTFSYLAEDDISNSSSKIVGQNQFQVYQGSLPPLSVPTELAAKSLPNGKVKLSWKIVDKAVSYIIYRQGPSDATMVALDPIVSNELIDQTTTDGTYIYAVASVRNENGQESQSAKSATVNVKTDRVTPAIPKNLTLELNGGGILSKWTAPALDVQGHPQSQEGLTYNLYRVARPQGQQVIDVLGLTPLQKNIPELIALDTKPDTNEHSYFVTAVDVAGNESAPSETVYLNFGLLPVRQLQIVLNDNGYPALTWQHTGTGIKSYRVSRRFGSEASILLTPEAITHTGTTTTYIDNTYNSNQPSKGASQDAVYSVVAVDNNNVESLAHELLLPALSVKVEKTSEIVIQRGVMNRVMFRVDNKGKAAAKLRLYVSLTENGVVKQHRSEYFDVAANASSLVPVVIGGYSKLDGIVDFTLRLEQQPQVDDSINISELEMVQAGNSSLTTSLETENFVRGGSGKVSFTITNTSDVETEVVLATNNGNADSNEVRLVLEDNQGNVLTQLPVKQFAGGINVATGQIVARIAPKGSFTSSQFSINVPFAAPDQVKLRLIIDKYHYHLGQDTHVEMKGVGAGKDILLSDTPYYADVDSIEPKIVYTKGQIVTITGHVKERITGQPMPSAPITIVYSVRGFELKSTVYSDDTGKFTFNYKSDGAAGKYRVSAVHPEVTDRPNQGEFIIEGASVSPSEIEVKIPRNYVQEIPLRIETGYDSTLANVRLVQLANGAVDVAQLPEGISVIYNPLVVVSPNSSAYLNLNFSSNNSAIDNGLISYRVEADNHVGNNALGIVNVHYSLVQAAPAISAKPAYIDSGVGLDKEVSENVVITNKGLDVLRGATIKLLKDDGTPAPGWLVLNAEASLGDVAIGAERSIQIVARPKAGVAEGDYQFKLEVKGDNFSGYSIPLFIKVTQSGIGKAFFHISDIYTATEDKNHQRIDGLGGATIRLQNENVLSESFSLNSDARGEALFENLPAGRYSYRVSAFDHGSVNGRIWIKPGVTTSEEVFAMNTLVNVEWSVKEITVEDRYEVKLEATFKTNVPVPLVMLAPLSVQLPVMKQGEVFQGEFTLTNYGLIKAENVKQVLPANSNLVRFEFLKQIPTTLEAGEVFILPYRIQALTNFNPEADAQATGGGCGGFNSTYSVAYTGRCVNDTVFSSQTQSNFNANWGACSSVAKQTISEYFKLNPPAINSSDSFGPGGGVPLNSDDAMWCIAKTECDDCNKSDGSGK